MAIAAEHLYESCTCDSGMRNGQRCGDCGGRGLLPKGVKPTGATVAEAAIEDEDLAGLEDMSINHLRSRAKELGLPTTGKKVELVKAIKAATASAEADADSDDGATDTEVGDEVDED